MKIKTMRFGVSRPIYSGWFAALCIGSLVVMLQSCKKSDPAPVQDLSQVKIGAVLALSGISSEEGKTSKASIECAIQDLNQRYIAAGSPTRFSCTFMDSQMDTVVALEALKQLHSEGVRFLAGGPNTSAELSAIKNYLDDQYILCVNCFSTAPSLAIKEDNIFRLIPDDNVQAHALARMMQHDEIMALVPVWRNDTYGNGLSEAVRVKLTDAGKTVLPGVIYDPLTVDFAIIMNEAARQVNEAISMYGPERVALLLISYQDAVGFFVAASEIEELDQIKWYGCDANAQKTGIINDPTAGDLACKVRFLAPVMAIGSATSVPAPAQALSERIFLLTGLHPDDMALTAYDAVMILGQCYNLTGIADPVVIKTILPEVCSDYSYLGLNRTLNEAGDLAGSNYIFWTVRSVPEGKIWDSYATWTVEDDRIQIKP